MRMPSMSIQIMALWAFALLATACASPGPRHEYELAPGRGFAAGGAIGRSVLVVPLNESTDTPAGLEKGAKDVSAALVAYLNAQGLRVTTLESKDYRKRLAAAAVAASQAMLSGEQTTVSESVEFADLIPHLLRDLDREVDLVVVPNMVIRTGELLGYGTVKWDGVKRRKPGTRSLDWTGTDTAASLWVLIYDEQGTRLFSGYGGLDLLFEINLQKRRQELIDDRLEDLDNLAQGVCIAFHPFFGTEQSCPRRASR